MNKQAWKIDKNKKNDIIFLDMSAKDSQMLEVLKSGRQTSGYEWTMVLY